MSRLTMQLLFRIDCKETLLKEGCITSLSDHFSCLNRIPAKQYMYIRYGKKGKRRLSDS